LPSMGQSVFSRWTRYRTKSGNLLTGSGNCTKERGLVHRRGPSTTRSWLR
jgi:hypothetical protein